MNARALEDRFLEKLVASLPRTPRQCNALRESDAELVRLPGGDALLAITCDRIVEEIELGLYEDPRLIGWMTVMVNLSDLAAVGAEPVGILLDQSFRHGTATHVLRRMQQGVEEACRAAGVAVLGGDTNFATQAQFGGTAIGIVPDAPMITRRGAAPGDLLFCSGHPGRGSAFALTRLRPGPEPRFRPAPRLVEGALVRRFASCATDSSDGLLASLDLLGSINGVGFALDEPLERALDPTAKGLARAYGLDPWMMLAGPHGDFELVFTLRPERMESFLRAASGIGFHPVPLGRVRPGSGVGLVEAGRSSWIDAAAVRDLAGTAARDLDAYVASLAALPVSGSGKLVGEEVAS